MRPPGPAGQDRQDGQDAPVPTLGSPDGFPQDAGFPVLWDERTIGGEDYVLCVVG